MRKPLVSLPSTLSIMTCGGQYSNLSAHLLSSSIHFLSSSRPPGSMRRRHASSAPPLVPSCRARGHGRGALHLLCVWLGEGVQPEWVEPLFAVFGWRQQGTEQTQEGNIRWRCGFAPSHEIWRTSPLRYALTMAALSRHSAPPSLSRLSVAGQETPWVPALAPATTEEGACGGG